MYTQKGSEHTCPQEGWSLGWMKQDWEDNQILTLFFSFFDMKTLFVHHLAISTREKQRRRHTRGADSAENPELGSVKAGRGGEGRDGTPLRIYRIVSLTSRSPWMTFWASLSVGTSEPPASQVQQHSRVQADVSWKGQLERHR